LISKVVVALIIMHYCLVSKLL